tara:strand:+ start:5491 stop:5787 length:297 start_codon:yes stop_codon:yes gene_type:complete
MKKYWDHSTSPSTYVVSRLKGKGKYAEYTEAFRGSYTDGMMYIKSLENDGMIDFENDYLPAMSKIKAITYRALMVEKELRRDIIRLKKELKAINENKK